MRAGLWQEAWCYVCVHVRARQNEADGRPKRQSNQVCEGKGAGGSGPSIIIHAYSRPRATTGGGVGTE